jgi:serine/threonine-protein kinase
VFLGDLTDKRIYKVDAAGTITTVTGTGESGPWKDGVPAVNANLGDGMDDIALDADGSLYVSDEGANAVRKIDPAGIVTTVTGGPGDLGDCGPAAKASIREPHGLAVRDGVLYIAEPGRIRMVLP